MYMNEPKLRFKADDGSQFPDWEEKKLNEIAVRVTRKNKDNVTDIPLTISSVDGLIDQRDFFNKVVASKDMSGYYLLKNGEFAYNKSYSKGYDFGSIKRLDLYDEGALSTLYICFALNKNENSDFYQKYFDSLSWYPELQKICAEGARNHGLLNVPTNDFFQLKLCVPSSEQEQQKIAEFLSTIDTVIAKQKETVSAWEERKKGVMQKLFSQEVRFKADDGSYFPDWEEKKIDDLFYKVNERNNGQFGKDKWISVAKMYYQDEDKVTSNNIDTRTYVMRVGDMSFEGHPNKEFKYGRFVVNDIGDGIISELFPIYRHKENYILKYWKYAIQVDSIMQKIYRKSIISSGASSNKLDDDDFKRQSILVPCLAEQQKIADCLSSFDEVIEKQKATLSAWEELKKGLLQQMFV